jgi:L-fuconolactonase
MRTGDPAPFVVDAQLHAAPGHATAEELLAMMDAVGVNAALLTQFSALGSDTSYILSLAAAHPDRFGAVGMVDAQRPELDEQLARWKEQPGAVGIRITIRSEEDAARLHAGWYEEELALAERAEVPVFVFCPGELPAAAEIARRHPELRLVVDHLGLPALLDEAGPHVFERLPEILALAELPNIAVKCSAAPIHSRQPFPYDDLWPHLERVFDAFGFERVLWGSDINRIGGMPFRYADALGFVEHTDRLGAAEKRLLLGDALRRWVRWSPEGAPPLGSTV